MTIDPRRAAFALVPLGAMAACAPVDHSFGEATAYNKAIQTINPDGTPPVEGAAEPGDNAEVAADSAESYREGTVERARVSTQGRSGSSSGNSGQSSTPR